MSDSFRERFIRDLPVQMKSGHHYVRVSRLRGFIQREIGMAEKGIKEKTISMCLKALKDHPNYVAIKTKLLEL